MNFQLSTLASFVLSATLLAAAPAQAVTGTTIESDYADAVQALSSGRSSEAFGRFRSLANRGDVDSARIALFMHMYGASIYGKHWDALPRDTAYWQQLASNSSQAHRAAPAFVPAAVAAQTAQR